ncbi:hypothetical protein ACTFIR_010595 [Dictyostelium discoideum]
MCSPSIFYSGGLEVCIICIKVMIQDEDELIRKELKSFENKVDNYVEDQKVHINKVIMDHCKRYPRESLYGIKSMDDEDQLKIPFKRHGSSQFNFGNTDEKSSIECFNCLEFHPISNYEKGEIMMCKRCLGETGRNFINSLESSARVRSLKHIKQGRKGSFNLNRKVFEKLCNDCDDRCRITDVKFNNSITYDTKFNENGSLCCNVEPILRIMQNRANWTRSSWLSVKINRDKDIFEVFDFSNRSMMEKVEKQIQTIFSFSKVSTKKRNNTIKRKNGTVELHQHNITKDFLLNLFISQGGKCNLSNIIMLAGEIKEEEEVFKISINRINNKEGYIEGNVELICLGFNSTDRSNCQLYTDGQQDWNKTVFKYMMKCLDESSRNILPTSTYQERVKSEMSLIQL